MAKSDPEEPPHPLGLVRDHWEKSLLRPWAIGLALILTVALGFIVLSSVLPRGMSFTDECVKTTTVQATDGFSAQDDSTITTTEIACSRNAVPVATLWVGVAILGILLLPEVATLLPGSKIPIPGAGDMESPPITHAPQRRAERIAEDANAVFLGKGRGRWLRRRHPRSAPTDDADT